tara:strand:- start:3945 stop:6218 length:2274 start_codon:yes stop_codon:yes gene_type:complete
VDQFFGVGSGTELGFITAANLTIGDDTVGNITVNGIMAGNSNNVGNVNLNARKSTSSITFATAGSTFNALTAIAGNDVNVNTPVTTDTGGLELRAGNDVLLAAAGDLTSAGNVLIVADNDGNLSGTGGAVTMTDGAVIDAGGNTITMAADENLTLGQLLTTNATSSAVTIYSYSGGIVDGGDTDQDITAASGGLILNVSDGLGTGAKGIENNIGLSEVVNAVSASISGGVYSGTATLLTMGLTSNDGLTINSDLTFSDAVFINADADSSGGGTFTVAAGVTVSSSNNIMELIADDVNLLGSLNSGSGTFQFTTSDGGSIGIGPTSCGGTCGMSISAAEAGNVTTSGGLFVGDGTNGSIYYDNTGDAFNGVAGITGSFVLDATASGGQITFSGDTLIEFETGLTAKADNGIIINVDLSTGTGNNMVLEGDYDNASDGTDSIAIASGITITSGGSMTLDSTSGGITAAGALTLLAAGGVFLNDNLTSSGTGAISINTDTDKDGTSDLTIASGMTLNTNNNSLLLIVNDLFLNGSINSGNASTTLKISDGSTIGLGYSSSYGMNIEGTELQNITATNLILGGSNNGNITVNGISAANSNNISGTFTLNATGNGKTVTFLGNSSAFNTLTVNAENGITVSANLTIDTGNFTADSDSDGDDSGTFTVDSGKILASVADVVINAPSIVNNGTITGNASLNNTTAPPQNNSNDNNSSDNNSSGGSSSNDNSSNNSTTTTQQQNLNQAIQSTFMDEFSSGGFESC